LNSIDENLKRIEGLLEKYDIEHWAYGVNVTVGWINVQCPFCSDGSNHCGISGETFIYHCWRCEARGPLSKLLNELTGIPEIQFEEFLESEGIDFGVAVEDQINNVLEAEKEIVEKRTARVSLPKFARKITEDIYAPRLKIFLEERKISIQTCIKHDCYICDVGDYANRLVIPVYFDGKLVSFQGRDMTGRSELRYRTAPGHINEFLYGYDTLPDDTMVITEGILDKWRVGNQAVASFGTSLTDTQKYLIIEKNPATLIFAWDALAYWKSKKQAEYFMPFINKIRVVLFPDKHDPDSYGKLNTWKLIDQTINL
jgi:DNA primase